MKLVEQTLDQLMVERPEPSADRPQHLCMDKGYDYDSMRDLIARSGFVAHIKSRGQEAAGKHHSGAKARRWVVERTHSWMNRFRRLLVRWEKKRETYLAMLHFALGIICWRAAYQ
ncbi:transposase [Massilia sp. CCM 8734]|nr:transposase [Massilia sp. CCM 8734]